MADLYFSLRINRLIVNVGTFADYINTSRWFANVLDTDSSMMFNTALPDYVHTQQLPTGIRITMYTAACLVVLCFYLTLIYNPLLYSIGFRKESLTIGIIAPAVLIALIIHLLFSTRLSTKVNKIDLTVILLGLVVLISRLPLTGSEPFLNEKTINLLLVLILYFCVRYLVPYVGERFFLWSIIPAFGLQLADIVFTYLANYGKGLSYMLLKGTLGNSGLCSGFIVICTPILVFLIPNKILKRTMLTLVTVVLIFLQSRAAWLSALALITWQLGQAYHSRVRKVLGDRVKWFVLLGMVILLSAVLAVYKKKSTMGRMLIWEITVKNIHERLFIGHGFGEFGEVYKTWQGNYFVENEDPENRFELADTPAAAFNEPLQFLVELGLVGLFSFGYLIWSVMSVKGSLGINMPIKLALSSGLIFALFSYPYSCMPILLLNGILLATIKTDTVYSIKIRNISHAVLLPSAFLLIFFEIYGIKRYVVPSNYNLMVDRKESLLYLERNLPLFRNNSNYLRIYANNLLKENRFRHGIEILDLNSAQSPDIGIDIKCGDAYLQIGDLKAAKKKFLNAARSIPNRLTPKYRLFLTYLKEGDTAHAIAIGEHIISYRPKVNTIEAIRIQSVTSKELLKLKNQ